MSNNKKAVIIGNSDGIGLALTKRLLNSGWNVLGLSRSPSSVNNENYIHTVVDVTSSEFSTLLSESIDDDISLCVYCAGIGEQLDFENLKQEEKIFQVNLIGAIKTIEAVLPGMKKRNNGHIIILSSIGDLIISPEAPSYYASKAGLSSYVEAMALLIPKWPKGITFRL